MSCGKIFSINGYLYLERIFITWVSLLLIFFCLLHFLNEHVTSLKINIYLKIKPHDIVVKYTYFVSSIVKYTNVSCIPIYNYSIFGNTYSFIYCSSILLLILLKVALITINHLHLAIRFVHIFNYHS